MSLLASFQIVGDLEAAGIRVVAARDLQAPPQLAPDPRLLAPGARHWLDLAGDDDVVEWVRTWAGAGRGRILLLAPTSARAHAIAARLKSGGIADVVHLERASAMVRRDARVVVVALGAAHDPLLVHHDRWSRLWRNLGLVFVVGAEEFSGGVGVHGALILRRILRLAVRLAPPALETREQAFGWHDAPRSLAEQSDRSAARPASVGDDNPPDRFAVDAPPASSPADGADPPGPVCLLAGIGLANGIHHGRSLLGARATLLTHSDRGEEAPARRTVPWVIVQESAGSVGGKQRRATVKAIRAALGAAAHSVPVVRLRPGQAPPMACGVWIVRSLEAAAWIEAHPVPSARYAACDPASEAIYLDHLLAASAEAPFVRADDRWFGPGAWKRLAPFDRRLVREERAEEGRHGEAWRYQGWEPIELLIQPDLIEREPFRVLTHGRRSELLGTLSHGELAFRAHPGAIFHIADQPLRVRAVDQEEREVRVTFEKRRAIAAGRATRPQLRRHHEILEVRETRPPLADGSLPVLGRLEVFDAVSSYDLIKTGGRKAERMELDPPFTTAYPTTAMWLDFQPATAQAAIAVGAEYGAALACIAHLLRSRLLWRIDARFFGEVVAAAYPSHAGFDGGGVFLHEAVPFGTGAAVAALELLPDLLRDALADLEAGNMGPPVRPARLQLPEPDYDQKTRRGAIALLNALLE